jgi:hypothetical protein
VWKRRDIRFELEIADTSWPSATVRIISPVGDILLISDPVILGTTLIVTHAHIQGADGHGLRPNAVSTANLQVIGQAFLEVFGYERLVIAGAVRTSGQRFGQIPRPIRFSRHREPPLAGRPEIGNPHD